MDIIIILRRCIFIVFYFASFHLLAQFSEDFSDEDLTHDPTWLGNLQNFQSNESLRLQLNASGAGESYLTTSSEVYSNATWELYFEFKFNPSSQNYSKIYLISDRINLSEPVNGYYVMIGGSSDEISLYNEEMGSVTKLIQGEEGKLDKESISGKIKVSRNTEGKWELWTAIPHGSEYQKEGENTDKRNTNPLYFGIYCQYTSTRSDKIYFDDIKVTGISLIDTISPELISIRPISSNQLEAVFSEPLNPSIISQLENFEIQPEIGNPQRIESKDNNSQLEFHFSTSFVEGQEYVFTAANIEDSARNESPILSLPFLYFVPQHANYRDITINEIMADPSPVVGLPEAEYIEIYNRADKSFDLSGWSISDGSRSGALASGLILPKEYMILCAAPDSVLFSKNGRLNIVSGFPSLNNEGEKLIFRNHLSEVIDEVDYTIDWYKSSLRNDGGHSLEMIDFSNPCSTEDNWSVSEHPDGGTPGTINSIYSSKPDNVGPRLEGVYPTKDSLLLTFNEILDPESVKAGQYLLNDKDLTIETYLIANGLEVLVKLSSPLSTRTAYTIVVNNIKDCNGNFVSKNNNRLGFSLPEKSDSLDVIINEILFNPNSGGADFVEIYNNSAKYLDLKDWNIANIETEKESGKSLIANRKKISEKNYLFAPQEFLVLTTDVADIKKHYPASEENKMLSLTSLPSFPDDEGSAVLINEDNLVVDKFFYQEALHSPIVSKPEGVSLERISFSSPTQNTNNWTSAASTAAFATPGAPNSQSRRLEEFTGTITLNPAVIIPNNDGNHDFTTIQYVFGNQNYIGNVYVYDMNGNKVKTIAENESFSSEGFFSWGGTSDKGEKLRLGVYMILVEVFNLKGKVKVYKEPVAIGTEF